MPIKNSRSISYKTKGKKANSREFLLWIGRALKSGVTPWALKSGVIAPPKTAPLHAPTHTTRIIFSASVIFSTLIPALT